MPLPVDLDGDQVPNLLSLVLRTWGASDVETQRLALQVGAVADRRSTDFIASVHLLAARGKRAWEGGNAKRVVAQLNDVADEARDQRLDAERKARDSRVKP